MAKKQLTIAEYVTKYKVNKAHLAEKVGIPVGSIKNKLFLPAWRLMPDEEKRILNYFEAMAADVANIKLEQQEK